MKTLGIGLVGFAVCFAGAAVAAPGALKPEGPLREAPPPSPIDGPRKPKAQLEDAVEEKEKPPLPPRAQGTTWIGWSLGSGYGWHRSAILEGNQLKQVEASFGPGALGHFGAEIGYQWKERMSLALQTRHQVIPQTVQDPGAAGGAKTWAHSALLRLNVIYPQERYQFFVGGLAGAGQGFRIRIPPQPSSGLGASDTVRGGPGVVGAVAGVLIPFVERLTLVAEARALAGVPDLAAMAEVNLGLQFDISGL